MALSNSYNYNTTRDDIIKRALRIIGALGQGETPASTAVTEAAQALNDLVKEWQADGMQVWESKNTILTPTVSVGSYSVGTTGDLAIPTPFKILDVWRVTDYNTSSQTNVKLIHKTQKDWLDLPSPENTGTPIYWTYLQGVSGELGYLKVSPKPDSNFISDTGRLLVFYTSPIMDFDSSTDYPDFPSYMINALVWNLADQLSYEYGVGVVERSQISKKADKHKALALSYDQEEGSIFIQPTNDWYNG